MIFSKYYFYLSYYNLGSDILSKLPNIFHNSSKINSNNKHSYNTFLKEEKFKKSSIDVDNLINYFNKKITVIMDTNEEYNGILLSKRDNYIMLDTGKKLNIKNIISIK